VYPTDIQSMNMSWSEENSLMKLNVVFSFTDLQIMQSNAKNTQSAAVEDSNETGSPDSKDLVSNKVPPVTPVPPDTPSNSPSVVLEGLPQTLDIFGNPIIIA
jgi:hypothetical protein